MVLTGTVRYRVIFGSLQLIFGLHKENKNRKEPKTLVQSSLELNEEDSQLGLWILS